MLQNKSRAINRFLYSQKFEKCYVWSLSSRCFLLVSFHQEGDYFTASLISQCYYLGDSSKKTKYRCVKYWKQRNVFIMLPVHKLFVNCLHNNIQLTACIPFRFFVKRITYADEYCQTKYFKNIMTLTILQ
jgi:hypothetical protein